VQGLRQTYQKLLKIILDAHDGTAR
jgi:hypothetical protein